MKELEAALQQASTSIQQDPSKRDLSSVDSSSCSSSCLTGKAGAIVSEVTYTIKGVVNSLGLGEFKPFLQPGNRYRC